MFRNPVSFLTEYNLQQALKPFHPKLEKIIIPYDENGILKWAAKFWKRDLDLFPWLEAQNVLGLVLAGDQR